MFSSRAAIGQLVQSYTFYIREENESNIWKYLFENQVLKCLHVFLVFLIWLQTNHLQTPLLNIFSKESQRYGLK